jgi:hypothetical protein
LLSSHPPADREVTQTHGSVSRSWARQRLGFALPGVLTKSVHWANVTAYQLLGSNRTFPFQGRRLKYFYHHYNHTASNERTIEIPIIEQFVKPGLNVLEVGNVLNHYHPFAHDVIDKYEVAAGVINCDIVDYTTSKRYDLIVSVSTIEHVGWDEPIKQPGKPMLALEAMKRLLAPAATMVVTVPGGYNPFLDEYLDSDLCACRKHYRYQRVSWHNAWQEVTSFTPGFRYRHPYPFASTLHVLIY